LPAQLVTRSWHEGGATSLTGVLRARPVQWLIDGNPHSPTTCTQI
jgi:hypothetical protein